MKRLKLKIKDDDNNNGCKKIQKLIYPTPKPLKFEIEDPNHLDLYRNFKCLHYSICLDKAVVYDWVSFSCRGCKLFIREDL